MKKRIVMLLCTAILTLGLTAAPAMASAGPFTPIEVETYISAPLTSRTSTKCTGSRQPTTHPAFQRRTLDLLPFWVCAGCMAMAAAIELCAIKSKQKGESK